MYKRQLEESELLKFLNELREARPELTTDDINRFCAELAVIRREGVGFDCEEIFTGVRCVAAPIFDYTGNLVATIGCSVPTAVSYTHLDVYKRQGQEGGQHPSRHAVAFPG